MIGDSGNLHYIDAEPYLQTLEVRFGIPTATLFERYQFFRSGARNLVAVSRSIHVPRGLIHSSAGIRILRISMATPKPTSEAVPLLGVLASRNIADVSPQDMWAVRAQERFRVPKERVFGYSGPGFIVLRFRGIPVALAQAIAEDGTLQETVTLASWFPTRRLGRLDAPS